MMDVAKAVLRGAFIAINAYIRKNVEISKKKKQINSVTLYLEELENEEYSKSKVEGRK